ncbi:hypothetical protein POM88_041876 [Heracleum sosnowskyi]|uniref:RNase H type-1 domain-containing protein n=1 Tax=Heracleum sosnowskyi TaxID=360622 RepID=A0AAD8M8Q6_9APIA|nr:hypothetical protein POM88_041876 [Heracleum sosnowskyi]
MKFMALMYWSALATKSNLFRRKYSQCPLCPICNYKVETVEHMLFECDWTRPVWFSSSLGLFQSSPAINSIVQWLTYMISVLDTKKDILHFLSNFAFIGWSIWLTRNKFVYDHIPVCPVSTVKFSSQAQSEYVSLLETSCLEPRSAVDNSSLQWIPLVDTVKFNCNGAFKHGLAAIGVIGRDYVGQLVDSLGCRVQVSTPLEVELIAIREACFIISHQQLSGAIVELDCKTAINLLNSVSDPP